MAPRTSIAVISVRSDKFLLFLGRSRARRRSTRTPSPPLAARLRERVVETLPRHLSNRAMAPLTFQHGHALLQRDPMLRAERAIHRALDEAMLMSLHRRSRDEDRRAHDLDALIRDGNIETLYQPILDLRDLTVLGHEVFSRGPAGSALRGRRGPLRPRRAHGPAPRVRAALPQPRAALGPAPPGRRG